MADKSAIEWTDATWTPIRARLWEIQNDGSGKERIGWHCEHASEGCRNCYAEGFNRRLGTGRDFKPGELYREEKRGYQNGEIKLFLDEAMLTAPLRWKKPRMIFVCSMTDLFADFVPDEWIDRVFAVMALAPQHTFQVLTKRAKRMRAYVSRVSASPIPRLSDDIAAWMGQFAAAMPDQANRSSSDIADELARRLDPDNGGWPLPNVWLGVSAERRVEWLERTTELRQTPAAVRFVSAEPLLGDLGQIDLTGLDWIIVGGESGPDARPMHPAWARSIRDQCAAADVPFFFKQWGEFAPARTSAPPSAADINHIGDHPVRVGKKAAGRLLDGVEHNAMPELREVPAL
ncbi:DUF5131 family protein [Mesorhizobium sp.]|uniref:DUF5131 family protein n=1 Tax=Mesorhizobium sp. TaxID=1871066 RepID=UPI001226AD53|nr:phage Gp37/Gp68 family protein [Mesorhizobium sp.]TIX20773.1 MAG: phage Gp37/Gp68 family protein [Mesorhizobium sp.]